MAFRLPAESWRPQEQKRLLEETCRTLDAHQRRWDCIAYKPQPALKPSLDFSSPRDIVLEYRTMKARARREEEKIEVEVSKEFEARSRGDPEREL